jgi:DNA-binding FadR family transcriptional regulator
VAIDDPPLFRPIKDRRVFEDIVRQLEDAIVAGRLGPGDRLPSERDLSQQFGVARTSVREALRVLEALGVIGAGPGERGAMMISGSGNAFRDVLRFQLALQQISVSSLVEFRIVIESWAASAAAQHAGLDDVQRLHALVEAMNETDVGPTEFHVLDSDFHLAIARASRNELLVLVLEGARSAIERAMRQALVMAGRADWPHVRARLVGEHDGIVSAIDSNDADRSAELIAGHIRRFYAETLMQDADVGALDTQTLDIVARRLP